MDFQSINLGMMSAEQEANENPRLLREGFMDFGGIVDKLKRTSTFLVLGEKGSGKTTIAKHFEFEAADNPKMFVQSANLSEFPYTPFSQMVVGQGSASEKMPIAWQWIFCLLMLELISKDASLEVEEPHIYQQFLKALRKEGYLESVNLRDIVSRTKRKGFKIDVFATLGFEYDEEREGFGGNVNKYARSLKRLFSTIKSDNSFHLFIDGMDEVLFAGNDTKFDAIGILIDQASKFNSDLRMAGLNAKIVILCREDILRRASGANLNKVRQGLSATLNWYTEADQDPKESLLYQLVEHRAALSLSPGQSYFESFFGPSLDDGPYFRTLLAQTRHLPRDMIMLLERIHEVSNEIPVKSDEFLQAGVLYSDYLRAEINDSLFGFAKKDHVEILLNSMAPIGRSHFGFGDLHKSVDGRLDDDDLIKLCGALYECGALHCVRPSNSGNIYYAKYRNRETSFMRSLKIVVHRGLRKNLGLPLHTPLDL